MSLIWGKVNRYLEDLTAVWASRHCRR